MKVLKSLFSMVAFLASQGGNTVGPPVLEREQFMLDQTDWRTSPWTPPAWPRRTRRGGAGSPGWASPGCSRHWGPRGWRPATSPGGLPPLLLTSGQLSTTVLCNNISSSSSVCLDYLQSTVYTVLCSPVIQPVLTSANTIQNKGEFQSGQCRCWNNW